MLILNADSCARTRSDGFTLLEILVSLVVFSVGLLGVAALQATAKKANYDSVQRTFAAHVGYDLLERMRANNGAIADYLGTVGGATQAVPGTDCSVVPCTPEELADFDMWDWERSVDGLGERRDRTGTGGLSAPTVCITGPAGGVAGLYQVTLAWRGLTAVPNGVADACGVNTGLYGDDAEFRRVMILQTYLGPA